MPKKIEDIRNFLQKDQPNGCQNGKDSPGGCGKYQYLEKY
jgi:hypothetical protein